MRLITKDKISSRLSRLALRAALAQAFIDFSEGRARSGGVGHLAFRDPPGDFHIKSSATVGQPFFVVKAAGSFYRNPALDLPSSNGAMLLFRSDTGEPVACLADEGWLTDARTACAGAIAASLVGHSTTDTIGVVGSGTQARMQADWIARELGDPTVLLWARDPRKGALAVQDLRDAGLRAEHEPDLRQLAGRSDLVVTTTPSCEPLILQSDARPGLRIVAVGSDAPGKREVARELVERCDVIVVDSRDQCLAYGECAGLDPASHSAPIFEIGELLKTNQPTVFEADATVLVDLTGLGALDAAAASLFVADR